MADPQHTPHPLVVDAALGWSLVSVGNYLYGAANTRMGGGWQPNTLLRRYSKADGTFTNIAGAANGHADGIDTFAWFGGPAASSVPDVTVGGIDEHGWVTSTGSRAIAGITSDGTNLYVADENHYLRKVSPASPLHSGQLDPVNHATPVGYGKVSTVAGNGNPETKAGTGLTAGFNTPRGVAVLGDAAYVGTADAISRVDLTTGVTTILAGIPGTRGNVDALDGPHVTFDGIKDVVGDGTFLVTLSSAQVIRRTDPATGATSTINDGLGVETGNLNLCGLTVGPDGTLYVV